MSELRETSAGRYEQAAAELETAAEHLRTTARHLREGNVPRSAAHAWAAWGHISMVETALRALAELHASHSNPD